MRIVRLLSLFALATLARAQESIPPTAPPSPVRTVALRFAPPPMKGTVSLGIYDAKGKLVRVLHREDALSDFTAGNDAFETTWDGNDDAGRPLSPGKYRARGFLVGDLKVEGVDYFFNDWVTDETSPHLAHISRITAKDDHLELRGTIAGAKEINAVCDLVSKKLTISNPPETASAPSSTGDLEKSAAPIDPLESAPGKEGTLWTIRHVSPDSRELEIVQLSAPGTSNDGVLRKLLISPNEPQPVGIAASTTEERIFLLERAPEMERVRSLSLVATTPDVRDNAQSISDWKIDFEKKIVAHKNFAIEEGKAVASSPNEPTTPEKIAQKLQPNPLKRDQPDQVDVAVGVDADGSYLKTSDGLPLRTISDTANLSRALLARHAQNAIDVFQDDGAVVEQFRISNLDEMMAFDCGDFELK